MMRVGGAYYKQYFFGTFFLYLGDKHNHPGFTYLLSLMKVSYNARDPRDIVDYSDVVDFTATDVDF